jgi:predicted dehydrogenase
VVILGAQNLADEVREWTEGYGVDAVVLCTATASNTPVAQSAEVLRDRGRMVIVGNTKADLAWKTFYEKELDVRYSRSYGPGRYDPSYEWGGADYPISYVRWTEQRNFDACLHLMSTGQLDLHAITTRRVPFANALEVYRDLLKEGNRDVGVVLEYPLKIENGGSRVEAAAEVASASPGANEPAAVTPALPPRLPDARVILLAPIVRLDVIGAGNFARTMLLPHLKGKVPFGTIVNQTALSASHVKKKFDFSAAATDYAALFLQTGAPASPLSATGVVVATRHHLHAPIVKAALMVNRHIFVEKPLCLTRLELAEIDAAVAQSSGTVQVGFNRRFAGASVELKKLLKNVPGPKTASIHVMAGKLDPAHWYANFAESGGRVLGEACHFLDYFCFLFDSAPVRVTAQTVWPASGRLPFPDSVTAHIEFADGSSGQLIYSAEGDSTWPKERITVFGAGFVAAITNFQELVIHRGHKVKKHKYHGKGHAEQMAAWAAFLRGASEHPFPYAQTRQSMVLTFAVLEAIQAGQSVKMEG